MAKLGAESLQYLSPIAFDCTKPEISSDGGKFKITKWSCITHPNLARASATQFTSRNACYTL